MGGHIKPVGYFDPTHLDFSRVNRIGWDALVTVKQMESSLEAPRREAIEQCAQLSECYGAVNAADAIRDLLQRDS